MGFGRAAATLIFLLGETREELSGSEWAWVDARAPRRRAAAGGPGAASSSSAALMAEAARRGHLSAAHDLSDGGLAQALVEACLRRNVGRPDRAAGGARARAVRRPVLRVGRPGAGLGAARARARRSPRCAPSAACRGRRIGVRTRPPVRWPSGASSRSRWTSCGGLHRHAAARCSAALPPGGRRFTRSDRGGAATVVDARRPRAEPGRNGSPSTGRPRAERGRSRRRARSAPEPTRSPHRSGAGVDAAGIESEPARWRRWSSVAADASEQEQPARIDADAWTEGRLRAARRRRPLRLGTRRVPLSWPGLRGTGRCRCPVVLHRGRRRRRPRACGCTRSPGVSRRPSYAARIGARGRGRPRDMTPSGPGRCRRPRCARAPVVAGPGAAVARTVRVDLCGRQRHRAPSGRRLPAQRTRRRPLADRPGVRLDRRPDRAWSPPANAGRTAPCARRWRTNSALRRSWTSWSARPGDLSVEAAVALAAFAGDPGSLRRDPRLRLRAAAARAGLPGRCGSRLPPRGLAHSATAAKRRVLRRLSRLSRLSA